MIITAYLVSNYYPLIQFSICSLSQAQSYAFSIAAHPTPRGSPLGARGNRSKAWPHRSGINMPQGMPRARSAPMVFSVICQGSQSSSLPCTMKVGVRYVPCRMCQYGLQVRICSAGGIARFLKSVMPSPSGTRLLGGSPPMSTGIDCAFQFMCRTSRSLSSLRVRERAVVALFSY